MSSHAVFTFILLMEFIFVLYTLLCVTLTSVDVQSAWLIMILWNTGFIVRVFLCVAFQTSFIYVIVRTSEFCPTNRIIFTFRSEYVSDFWEPILHFYTLYIGDLLDDRSPLSHADDKLAVTHFFTLPFVRESAHTNTQIYAGQVQSNLRADDLRRNNIRVSSMYEFIQRVYSLSIMAFL